MIREKSKEMRTDMGISAIERIINRNHSIKLTLSKIIKGFDYNGVAKLNHISLRLIFFALKKYAEIIKKTKNNKLILSKVSKLMHILVPHRNISMNDKCYFTQTKTLFLNKKRRDITKLEYKITRKRRGLLRKKLANEAEEGDQEDQIEAIRVKDIASDKISSIIDQSIFISYKNNLQYDKPFQSLTPTFSIKSFSFDILSPLSSPIASIHDSNKQSLLPHIQAATPSHKQYYPLTSTHANTIHNHIMIIQNNNRSSSKSNSNSNSSNSNSNKANLQKQFPFNTFPLQNPYFDPQAYLNINHSFSDNYYIKLCKDILEFTQSIDYFNALLYEAKIKLIEIVKAIAYETLQFHNIPISFEIFGSFANGLSIESSDIDLLIKYSNKQNYESTLIQLLQVSFKSSGLFSLVFPIPSAKIPVIKLIAPLSSIISEDKINIIIKDIPSIDSISIDIIFANIIYSSYLPSLEIVQYIRNAMMIVPCIKGIMLFLKKVLIKKKLNNYYNGGLSSFSLFILLFALIKYRSLFGKHNLRNSAFILLHFLDFYSKFNFDLYGVNINLSYSYGFIGPNAIYTPMIIDPISNLNIGSGTFKMDEIKKCFEELIEDLKTHYAQSECKGNIIINKILNKK